MTKTYWLLASWSLLLVIISLRIFRRRGQPRAFFLILGAYFFTPVLSGIYNFAGNHNLFGDDYLAFYLYQDFLLLQELILASLVAYIALRYVFQDSKESMVVLTAFVLAAVVVGYLFRQVLLDPYFAIREENINLFYLIPLKAHSYITAYLALFWFAYSRTDRPLGTYVNTIMFGFSVLIPLEMLHFAVILSNFSVVMAVTLYWSMGILAYFTVALLLKLYSTTTAFGTIYEQILVSGHKRFTRRRGLFDRAIVWLFFGPQENQRPLLVAGPTAAENKKANEQE